MAEEIRYHLPGIGVVSTPLHSESADLYRFLSEAGEIDRLRALDHLGIVRHAWEGAHHPRWEYVVLTSCIVEGCKPVQAVHFSKTLTLNGTGISSGSELLKCWSLLLNIGHLNWTFTAERALLLEIRTNQTAHRNFGDLLSFDADVRSWADDVIESGRVHQMFQVLAFLRLQQLAAISAQEVDPKWLAMLKAYVLSRQHSDKVVRLKAAYRNIRRNAYLALDTHYTPSLHQPRSCSDPHR